MTHHEKVPSDLVNYIADSRQEMLRKKTPWASAILFSIIFFFICTFIWATYAPLDEVTTGNGTVVPTSQVKTIQSLDGGTLSELLVHEGQLVQKGQVLAKIDDTRRVAEYKEKRAQYFALAGSVARLEAEANHKKTIKFPAILKSNAKQIISREKYLFSVRKQAHQDKLQGLRRAYELINQEYRLTYPIYKKGAASKIEILRLKRERTRARNELQTAKDEYIEQLHQQLNSDTAKLESISENILTLQDKLQKTVLTSPVTGTINDIQISTRGEVIKPGMDIMEVVPKNDSLIIETHIKPADIGFIKLGQQATVKISAYDYAIYGGLDGTVSHIGPDTVLNEKDEPYYEVSIKTRKNYLGKTKGSLPVLSGMTATVQILTGQKTVMAYILKPLLRAKEFGLKER